MPLIDVLAGLQVLTVVFGLYVVFLMLLWLAIIRKSRQAGSLIDPWDLLTGDIGRLSLPKVAQFVIFVGGIAGYIGLFLTDKGNEALLTLWLSLGFGQAIFNKGIAVLPQRTTPPPSINLTAQPDGSVQMNMQGGTPAPGVNDAA